LIWISLDSLVRNQVFQWVVRLEGGKIFSARLGFAQAVLAAPSGAPAVQNRRGCSFARFEQVTSISAFQQQNVAKTA
jgi:hypothetical protein